MRDMISSYKLASRKCQLRHQASINNEQLVCEIVTAASGAFCILIFSIIDVACRRKAVTKSDEESLSCGKILLIIINTPMVTDGVRYACNHKNGTLLTAQFLLIRDI
ncbi:unnamed protein product [Leptosia nina]|uniref:Uncharacterized protein n=1 Tax=Leptosia nina TaxID=320188 RepID=A0AAV1JRH4_9NEOP